MQHFDLSQITPTPWKNAAGYTRELVRWPAGADMDSFGWRISVATIAQDGPFSAFAGVDRQMLLLDGHGVRLTGSSPNSERVLSQRWQSVAFAGEQPLYGHLLQGACTDFNVMTRRDQWQATMEVHGAAVPLGGSVAGLCLVLQGRFTQPHGPSLGVGQGLWWDAVGEGAVVQAEDPESRLVLVNLQPRMAIDTEQQVGGPTRWCQ